MGFLEGTDSVSKETENVSKETENVREKTDGEIVQEKISTIEQFDSDLLMNAFINILCHEIRTPAAVIQGAVELMGHHGSRLTEAEKMSYYNSIGDSVFRIKNTMDSLIIICKIQNLQMLFRPKKINVAKLCKMAILAVLSIHRNRKISLSISKSVPKCICADETLLHIIIANLLSNAVKFSGEDSEVFLRLDQKSKNLIIQIEDRGIGIRKADFDSVFHQFRRGTNITKYCGIGFGVFIVENCIKLHGGDIFVSSKENVGTVFDIVIPYTQKSLKDKDSGDEDEDEDYNDEDEDYDDDEDDDGDEDEDEDDK
jgi:signal transduction histidine kinase